MRISVLPVALLLPACFCATPNPKRGLVYIQSDTSASDASNWNADNTDLSWYYDYGPSPSPAINSRLEFVPMLWGLPENPATDTSFLDTVSGLIDSGVKIKSVLAFNEPDGSTQYGGSNIPAITAAQVWLKQIEPLKEKYNLTLGAPAVTAAPTGFNWLQNFFTECDGRCSVDFMNIHWYGDFGGLASYIGQMRAAYLNSTIWVTEWAFANQDLAPTQDFFKMSLEYFDRIDYIDRYSYFGSFRSSVSNVGPNAAMLTQNGALTDIGAMYLGEPLTGNVPSNGTSNRVVGGILWGMAFLTFIAYMM